MTPKSFRCTGTGSKGDFAVEFNKNPPSNAWMFLLSSELKPLSGVWGLTQALALNI